ncbi:helix-turn-helix domain-containing protein [Kineosporia sp. R_H_3]|uniref:nSTAND1 domain-containing NTPase n=1 Tax=Kineosporia sp. R_H_3 TaxID=1961848 RepID=UPI001303F42F|nr:helix-turn-helix domain-containing protein [Kineosporia sp. R_H_3]
MTTPAEWSAGLQRLREGSGLSVRDLARAVGASSSTVGGYVSGRHLPTIAAGDLVERILVAVGLRGPEVTAWLDALHRVRRVAGQRTGDSPAPYKGLAGYDVEDARWFCGREELTDRLVSVVDGAPARPVVVVGASGSGKSSLIRAGLAARLVDDGWRLVVRTPGPDPVGAVAEVTEAAGAAVAEGARVLVVVDQLEELWTTGVPEDEWRTAAGRLAALAASAPSVAVVAGLRADFYAQALAAEPLAEALQTHQLLIRPMTRAELVRAVTDPAALAGVALEDGLVDVLLRDVAPDGRGTDGRRTDGAAYEPGALPLLSFALLQTWQRRRGRLTVADYLAAGGIGGAVSEAAERVYAGLGTHEKELARRLFTRLVAVGEETADARRRVSHDDIDALDAADDPGAGAGIGDVVEAFVSARLLTAGGTHVEITHEALIVAWPRLRAWLDEDRAGLLLQRGLSDDATAWDRSGREPGRLLHGPRLEALREWAQGSAHAGVLTSVERDFLRASATRAAEERARERRRTRVLQLLATGLAAALLAVLALAGYTFTLRADAESDRDLALSRQLAEAANRIRTTDPVVSAQLALLAHRTAPTVEARSALLDATAVPLSRRLDGPGGIASVAVSGDGRLMAAIGAGGGLRLWSEPRGEASAGPPRRVATVDDAYADAAHPDLYAVAVNADGSRVATGGLGGAVRLWDTSDPSRPRPVARLDTRGLTVLGLAFSARGVLAAALTSPVRSEGGRVGLWIVSGTAATALTEPVDVGEPVQSVAFDATGEVLAAGTDAGPGAGRVHRFDLRDGVRPVPPALTGPTAVVTSLAFAPDGRTLVAGAKDLLAHVWTLAAPAGAVVPAPGAAPDAGGARTLSGAQSYVNAVAFSPDGTTLVAGSADSRTRVYDTATYGLVADVGNPGPLTAAVYLPGGSGFATAGADGAVRLWPAPLPMGGIEGGRTFALAYVGSDRVLAMTSLDSARLLDVSLPFRTRPLTPNFRAPTPVDGGEKFAGTLAVSRDGRRFAAGGRNGTTWLYDLGAAAAGDVPVPVGEPLTRQSDLVQSAALTPDGRRLVTGSDDASLVLTDVTDPAAPKPLGDKVEPGGVVYALAASPDGRFFASGTGTGGGVDIWRADGPTLTKVASAPRDGGPALQVYGLSFTPDGSILAVGSADRTVRFLDLGTPQAPRWTGRPITGPGDYVFGVSFDAAGRRLATASGDGVLRVYDTSDPAEPVQVAALGAAGRVPLYSVALRPDGDQVSAAGGPEAVYTWTLDVDAAAARVCALAGDPIGAEEWRRYVPSVPYTTPCGSGQPVGAKG